MKTTYAIPFFGAACLFFGAVLNAKAIKKDDPLSNSTPATYFTYNHNVQCNVSNIAAPADVDELVSWVKHAIKTEINLKVIGSRHSTNDVICPGGDGSGVAINMTNFKTVQISDDKKFATLGAGLTILEASEALDAAGLSFLHIPGYLGITVGGAVGTGAHGSTLIQKSSISDQLVSMTVVTGKGVVRTISGAELDIFRVSLGLLGIIVDVTLPVVPQFKLTIQNTLVNESVYFSGEVAQMAKDGNELFQAWWFPGSQSAVLSTGKRAAANDTGLDHWNFVRNIPGSTIAYLVNLYETICEAKNYTGLCALEDAVAQFAAGAPGATDPVFTNATGTSFDNPATGLMYKMVAGICAECFWNAPTPYYWLDVEFSVPLSDFTNAMIDIKAILDKNPVCFAAGGIFNRFVQPSTGLMSADYGTEPRAHIEFYVERRVDPHKPRLGLVVFQEIEQLLELKYKGRAHWGKNNIAMSSPPIPQKTYPNLAAFAAATTLYDPHSIFANDFSNRVLHNAPGPRLPYCALESYCYCQIDDDCGKATTGLSCVSKGPYQVCA